MNPQEDEGYFGRRLADPAITEEVRLERQRIEAIDRIIRALDDERERQGLTKVELARVTNKRAEFVRRLFTSDSPNPTLETVVDVAQALGLEVTLTARTNPA